jgi:hypothetical protein
MATLCVNTVRRGRTRDALRRRNIDRFKNACTVRSSCRSANDRKTGKYFWKMFHFGNVKSFKPFLHLMLSQCADVTDVC